MLLQASDIHVAFPGEGGGFFRAKREHVLKGVSLSLQKGQCLGIVGESGSGKSTLGRVLVGLLKPERGQVLVGGKGLYETRNKAEKRALCRQLSVVFQNYYSSVNPYFRVSDIIGEALSVSGQRGSGTFAEEIVRLLEKVGLDPGLMKRYPHELSGGQLQRVCIARAVATKPGIMLLDEAVSSLDVSVQVQILDLLIALRAEENLSYIFITHDLAAVTYICDAVLFMKDGLFVEEVHDMRDLHAVRNPYSKKLLESVPGFDA